MKKNTYFDSFPQTGWPSIRELQPFFLAPRGKEWSFEGGNDSWGLDAQGLDGTEHLPRAEGVHVHLYMIGNPDHGVHLVYDKWDGRTKSRYRFNSEGDLGRLYEYVESLHETRYPIGLFVSFAAAWNAVKEFVETDGELPKSIKWIADKDLPPDVFPDPLAEPPPK
jgi:hypothetical protein